MLRQALVLAMTLLAFSVSAQAESLRILTTTEDLRSIAEFVGREHVQAESLGRGIQNYHFIAAKPSFMIKARKADLFIRLGLEMEIGYETLILEGSRNRRIQIGSPGHMDASIGIKPLEVPGTVDRSMGDIHAHGNPHYWLDPENAKIIADHMAQRFGKLDAANKDVYMHNATAFKKMIDEKLKVWQAMLSPYIGEKIITYHDGWVYFAKRFGFEVIGELEPMPGIAPSPAHLKKIIQTIKNNQVKVIVSATIYKDNAANFVASKTDAQAVIVPMSVGGSKESTDYIRLLDEITQKIIRGYENV